MRTQELVDSQLWAEMTFGQVQLKDVHWTRRVVKAVLYMTENASASLPAHMQTWKEVIGLYRLLDEMALP